MSTNLPATQGQQYALPSRAELWEEDYEKAFKNDQLGLLLHAPIPRSWIKKHPMVKVKNETGAMVALEYLPVDKVKFLLRRIFNRVRITVMAEGTMFNSVFVRARVEVWNPAWKDWDWHDGLGAVAAQTDSGTSAADLQNIKSNAIQIGLPAAYSYAVKNACENFGPVFGALLNKWDAALFEPFAAPSGGFTASMQEPKQVTQADIKKENSAYTPAPDAAAGINFDQL